MLYRRLLLARKNGQGGGIIDTSNYLTIEALEDRLKVSLSINDCEYCIDGDGMWKTLYAETNTPAINTGQTISFRGNLIPSLSNGVGTFTINKYHNLKGNCMSLLFGDEAKGKTDLSGYDNAFKVLFSGNTLLYKVASDFLPATTLAEGCYHNMFRDCTSLITAPSLPAITLAIGCYQGMFSYCSKLVNAPELHATTLVGRCYRNMFTYCSSLSNITMLATDISANGCLVAWVANVSLTGTFNKNAAMNDLPIGVSGIPEGWTVFDYGTLITFTIDDIEYQAEEGMTWADWVESGYNTDKLFVFDDHIVNYEQYSQNSLKFVQINYNSVLKTDIIVKGAEYEYYIPGSGT